MWELGNRTVKAVKAGYPEARIIWGFSNITFFHTPPPMLPAMMDGQSYHPYGVGTRRYPDQEQMPTQPWLNVDKYSPKMEVRMPEGWRTFFIRPKALMRLINPLNRSRHPLGTERFYHYMSEHGVYPRSNWA